VSYSPCRCPKNSVHVSYSVRNLQRVTPLRFSSTGSEWRCRLDLTRLQRDLIVNPLQQHMPENHRKYLSYNDDDFLAWASGIGVSTLAVHSIISVYSWTGKTVGFYAICSSANNSIPPYLLLTLVQTIGKLTLR